MLCLIRKIEVAPTPEESVRQRLLSLMINHLKYPSSGFVVEQALSRLPHIAEKAALPLRRADIIFFGKKAEEEPLLPLLLIECKAILLNASVISQAIGYNYHLEACAIAIANQTEIQTGLYDPKQQKYQFFKGLPSFSELKDLLNREKVFN